VTAVQEDRALVGRQAPRSGRTSARGWRDSISDRHVLEKPTLCAQDLIEQRARETVWAL